jgi:hypothetical protein
MGVGGHGINLAANGPELLILVRQILQLRGTDKGKVRGIEEKYTPLAQDILLGYKFEIVFVERIGSEIGNFPVDHRHCLIPPKIMLIAKGVDGAYFISVTQGKFRPWLILRGQMGILNAVFRLQANPFNIMLRGHGMGNGPYADVDNIVLYVINRNMLFSGCLCSAGNNLVHLFTAAVDRHTFVPDHGDDIATVFANIKFLLHIFPPSMESVSEMP